MVITKVMISYLLKKVSQSEMIYEMRLIEYSNPSNKTYSNKHCGGGGRFGADCKTGFLFCLVDLPFRNPQNCSLGDFTTPVLGGNSIRFNVTNRNNTYKFPIHKLPSVRKLFHFFSSNISIDNSLSIFTARNRYDD